MLVITKGYQFHCRIYKYTIWHHTCTVRHAIHKQRNQQKIHLASLCTEKSQIFRVHQLQYILPYWIILPYCLDESAYSPNWNSQFLGFFASPFPQSFLRDEFTWNSSCSHVHRGWLEKWFLNINHPVVSRRERHEVIKLVRIWL